MHEYSVIGRSFHVAALYCASSSGAILLPLRTRGYPISHYLILSLLLWNDKVAFVVPDFLAGVQYILSLCKDYYMRESAHEFSWWGYPYQSQLVSIGKVVSSIIIPCWHFNQLSWKYWQHANDIVQHFNNVREYLKGCFIFSCRSKTILYIQDIPEDDTKKT